MNYCAAGGGVAVVSVCTVLGTIVAVLDGAAEVSLAGGHLTMLPAGQGCVSIPVEAAGLHC